MMQKISSGMKVVRTKFWVYKPRKRRWEEQDEEKEEEYKSVPHGETEDLSRICLCSVAQISTFSINIALKF
jgi:hypothetical protein